LGSDRRKSSDAGGSWYRLNDGGGGIISILVPLLPVAGHAFCVFMPAMRGTVMKIPETQEWLI
jgi:hypothetical protein